MSLRLHLLWRLPNTSTRCNRRPRRPPDNDHLPVVRHRRAIGSPCKCAPSVRLHGPCTLQRRVRCFDQPHWNGLKVVGQAPLGFEMLTLQCSVEQWAKPMPKMLDWCLLHRRDTVLSGINGLFRSFVLGQGASIVDCRLT